MRGGEGEVRGGVQLISVRPGKGEQGEGETLAVSEKEKNRFVLELLTVSGVNHQNTFC